MNSIEDILVIIVLYKQMLLSSNAFLGFQKAVNYINNGYLNIFIYDNSPQEFKQDPISPLFGKLYVKYVRNESNVGVSFAYNRGAEYASQIKKKWILLFDQDTVVSVNFLSILMENINLYKQEFIFVPRLICQNVQLSPCKYYFARGFPYKKEQKSGPYTISGRNILNSGVCIRLDIFLQLGGYNENVPLYYSDFVFFDKFRKKYSNFVLIDISIQHEMSALSINFEKAKKTHMLFCMGAKFAGMVNPKNRMYYFINSLVRSIILSIRYKKLDFFMDFCHIISSRK